MVQWINIFWNNSFINPWWLSFLSEKTGAIALVQLQVLWQAGRQNAATLILEIFKIMY